MPQQTWSVPDTELSLTAANRRNELVDNIFQGTAFLNAMSRLGGYRTESGGEQLVTPLRMAKNTAAGSFDGYDILDTTPQDTSTSARYQWAGLYATISLSWMEDIKNRGPGKIIDITQQKTEDAMMTIRDKLNVQLMADDPAAGSKDVNSIAEIISEDTTANPARTESIGSISQATSGGHAFWRNKATDGGAFTIADMNTMWNNVSDGIENPDFLFTSSTVYEYYENSQVGLIRYGDSRIGDAGFDDLLYKRAPMIWDPQIAHTDEIYFINTDYLKLTTHADGDFIFEPFQSPDNQAAKTAKILWAGNLECSNRRRVGTLHGIDAPA
jgi:hypothetical protein